MNQKKLTYSKLPLTKVFCSCCEEEESSDHNQIVFCDGCDLTVHQECYHITNFNSNDAWFCQVCSLKEGPKKCHFCPSSFLYSMELIVINDEKYWAHSSCLKWHQYLELQPESMNVYNSTGPITTNNTCTYCGQSGGYVCDCNFFGCQSSFHIGCLKVRGGILNQETMENINNIMQPNARVKQENPLYCIKHIIDCRDCELKTKILKTHYFRLNNFFVPNNRNEDDDATLQKSQVDISRTQRRNKYYEDQLFDDLFKNKQFKTLKIPIKDKKVRAQFKDYIKKRLNEQLQKLKEQFYQKNQVEEGNDTYVQLDIQISKKLFDEIVDIHNLEAFDQYLVNYFIYNNMVERFNNPCVVVKDEQQHGKFWKSIMDELKIKNGEKLAIFLNELRFRKMFLVSRKVQQKQEASSMLANLGVEAQETSYHPEDILQEEIIQEDGNQENGIQEEKIKQDKMEQDQIEEDDSFSEDIISD